MTTFDLIMAFIVGLLVALLVFIGSLIIISDQDRAVDQCQQVCSQQSSLSTEVCTVLCKPR